MRWKDKIYITRGVFYILVFAIVFIFGVMLGTSESVQKTVSCFVSKWHEGLKPTDIVSFTSLTIGVVAVLITIISWIGATNVHQVIDFTSKFEEKLARSKKKLKKYSKKQKDTFEKQENNLNEQEKRMTEFEKRINESYEKHEKMLEESRRSAVEEIEKRLGATFMKKLTLEQERRQLQEALITVQPGFSMNARLSATLLLRANHDKVQEHWQYFRNMYENEEKAADEDTKSLLRNLEKLAQPPAAQPSTEET